MKNKLNVILLPLIILLFSLGSCDEEPGIDLGTYSEGVLILNEGNFTASNSSVTWYDPQNGELTQDVYFRVNSLTTGDVLQSVVEYDDRLYLVVNNSGKILAINKETLQYEEELSGFTSPRYLLPINGTRAYLTDLFSNKISVLDLSDMSVIREIPTNGWTERMLLADNKILVVNSGADKILSFDTSNDTLVDSISTGREPNSIVKDANGSIWVLCSGGYLEELPALLKFNSTATILEQTYEFSDINAYPEELSIDNDGTSLYFINGDVFKMEIGASSLPAEAFIHVENAWFYGLGIDPFSGDIYTSDPLDYASSGDIYRFTEDGVLIETFKAGIIPGAFHFQ